ncbi:SLITRK2 [Branchiostoma lanceolatum]|uniref:SLITRK2 protein n=1 Tax=Branchiostoma lanceolatum TaxID=7740 RepID=A0A8J9VK43_BRALA|nr:SLITRK2 [Branchiostoma lanceolatum]
MMQSKALVLLLLASSHLHFVLAAVDFLWCPDNCYPNREELRDNPQKHWMYMFECHCPNPHNKEKSPCRLVGYGGTTNDYVHCLDSLPTRFKKETRKIIINHLRSSSLLERSFPNISDLQCLWIQKSNVSSIRPGAFRGLSRLRRLYLLENRISSLEPDAFLGLETLGSLFLDRNAISSVSQYAFRGLHNLVTLYLPRNRLSSLPVNALLQPKALAAAHLQYNRITTIGSDITRLKQNLNIRIYKNTLRCDGNLTWLICNLQDLTQISDRHYLRCASPGDLQGTPLHSAMRKDDCPTTTATLPPSTTATLPPLTTATLPPTTTTATLPPTTTTATLPPLTENRSRIESVNHDTSNVSISRPHNETVPAEDGSERSATKDDTTVSRQTTEMDQVILPGGDPITNKNDNSTYISAITSAVAVPLLLVLASVSVLFIHKRWRDASLANHDEPTSPETDGSQEIEPYAVTYAEGKQASDNSADREPNPAAQNQISGDDNTIQPYAVAYQEDEGPKIKPYAVAYKENVGQNDDFKIPLYAADCLDTPQDAELEADSAPPENIANQQAAILEQTVAQSEDQALPKDGIKATDGKSPYGMEEENMPYATQLMDSKSSKDSTTHVLYNPARGQ